MLKEIQQFWKRYRKNAAGVVGMAIVALSADMIPTVDPRSLNKD